MKTLTYILLAAAVAITVNGQATKLPPDVDKQSYNRLPVIKRDQLDAAGKKA